MQRIQDTVKDGRGIQGKCVCWVGEALHDVPLPTLPRRLTVKRGQQLGKTEAITSRGEKYLWTENLMWKWARQNTLSVESHYSLYHIGYYWFTYCTNKEYRNCAYTEVRRYCLTLGQEIRKVQWPPKSDFLKMAQDHSNVILDIWKNSVAWRIR